MKIYFYFELFFIKKKCQYYFVQICTIVLHLKTHTWVYTKISPLIKFLTLLLAVVLKKKILFHKLLKNLWHLHFWEISDISDKTKIGSFLIHANKQSRKLKILQRTSTTSTRSGSEMCGGILPKLNLWWREIHPSPGSFERKSIWHFLLVKNFVSFDVLPQF